MTVDASPLRVAIYTRISNDDEGKALGVARQRQDCEKRAEREGWSVVRVYEENDTGASRHSKKARPKYAAMIGAASAGEFDVILAYSASRLTRRPREFEDLIDLYEQHHTLVRTIVSGDDDLSTADGVQMARMRASADAGEAHRTSERVKAKQAQNRAAGLAGTRRAFGWAFGYDDNHQRVADVAHRDEFPGLQRGIRMILEGDSVSAVCRYWNGLGLATATGKPWTVGRAKDVLTRWRNAGVLSWRGHPQHGIETGWEPACNVEDLQRVRNIIEGRAAATPGPGRYPQAPLSHVLHCGKCGRLMVGGRQGEGGSVMTYRCSGARGDAVGVRCFLTIGREAAEDVVTRAVGDALVAGEGESLMPTAEERQAVSGLYDERVEIVADEAQISAALAARTMRPAAALPALAGLAQRVDEIDREITSITSRYVLRSLFEGSVFVETDFGWTGSTSRAAKVREEYEGLSTEQKRAIARALLHIEVAPGRGTAADRVVMTSRLTGRPVRALPADGLALPDGQRLVPATEPYPVGPVKIGAPILVVGDEMWVARE